MINTIGKVLTNPKLVNIANNTDSSVAAKTTVNSIGRPGFILADKNISKETKKYAAAKEFLYQAACLGVYMALIVPVFKKYGFKIAKNRIFKNTQGFEYFNNLKEYNKYRQLSDILDIDKRNKELDKLEGNKKIKFSSIIKNELKQENPKQFTDIKGAVNLSNIIGSVIGLSIIAPIVSNKAVQPILGCLGSKISTAKNDN